MLFKVANSTNFVERFSNASPVSPNLVFTSPTSLILPPTSFILSPATCSCCPATEPNGVPDLLIHTLQGIGEFSGIAPSSSMVMPLIRSAIAHHLLKIGTKKAPAHHRCSTRFLPYFRNSPGETIRGSVIPDSRKSLSPVKITSAPDATAALKIGRSFQFIDINLAYNRIIGFC